MLPSLLPSYRPDKCRANFRASRAARRAAARTVAIGLREGVNVLGRGCACLSHPWPIVGANTLAVVYLRWRFGPEPMVEDQQANGHQTPDQAVEPGHPGRVGTGLPQGAGLDGAFGRVRGKCE